MTREELRNLVRRSHTMAGLGREVDRQLRELDEKQAKAAEQARELKKRNLKNWMGAFLGRTEKQLSRLEQEQNSLEKKRKELTCRKDAVQEELAACETLLALSGEEEFISFCRREERDRDIAEAIRRGNAACGLCKDLLQLLEQAREPGPGTDEAGQTGLDEVRSVSGNLGRQLEDFAFALEPLGESLRTEQLDEVKHFLYDGQILEMLLRKRSDDALERVNRLLRGLCETVDALETKRAEYV